MVEGHDTLRGSGSVAVAGPQMGRHGLVTDPVSISVLGGFEVRLGDAALPVPTGLPSQGVKFVVANGGRVHSEALIDALWPDASIDDGRKGVRNLLSRLSRSGAAVLVRDGGAIRVADAVSIDALSFQAAADRVLMDASRPGAAEGARFALARYRGEFLPDDRYCDWAVAPRERLRRRQLALIDLLAADARRRGEPLEAVSILELAIEVEPEDEIRYLEAAELLIVAGRRARAAVFMTRARQVLRDHGLLPGDSWNMLQRQLHEVHRPSSDVEVDAGR